LRVSQIKFLTRHNCILNVIVWHKETGGIGSESKPEL